MREMNHLLAPHQQRAIVNHLLSATTTEGYDAEIQALIRTANTSDWQFTNDVVNELVHRADLASSARTAATF